MDAYEVLSYSLPVIETLDELAAAPADTPAWYLERRRQALTAASATSTAKKVWNALLHPRGRDGKFIEKGGWVKFSVAGQWQRGQVSSIKDDGTVVVKGPYGQAYYINDPTHNIYSAPKQKATLTLPDINKKEDKGFVKVAGQGGSNPGGMFETKVGGDPAPKATTPAVKPLAADKTIPALAQEWPTDGTGELSITAPHQKLHADFKEALSQAGAHVEERQVELEQNPTKKNEFTVTWWTEDWNEDPEIDGSDVWGSLDLKRTEYGWIGYAGDVEKDGPGSHLSNVPTAIEIAREKFIKQHGIKLVKKEEFPNYAAIDPASVGKPDVTEAPDTGGETQRWYVKQAKSKNHAASEFLANTLYEAAGVDVPDVRVNDDKSTIASRVTLGERKGLKDATPEELSQIRSDLVIDAWLANWDVVGLAFDNMILVPGDDPKQPWRAQRIDAGGSLLYRAQGSPKGAMFGEKVGELKSLRDPSVNGQAAKIFGPVTDAELQDGAARLAAIHPDEIKGFVADSGIDNPDDVAKILIARRADLLKQLGFKDYNIHDPEPVVPGVTEPVKSVITPVSDFDIDTISVEPTGDPVKDVLAKAAKADPDWEMKVAPIFDLVPGGKIEWTGTNAQLDIISDAVMDDFDVPDFTDNGDGTFSVTLPMDLEMASDLIASGWPDPSGASQKITLEMSKAVMQKKAMAGSMFIGSATPPSGWELVPNATFADIKVGSDVSIPPYGGTTVLHATVKDVKPTTTELVLELSYKNKSGTPVTASWHLPYYVPTTLGLIKPNAAAAAPADEPDLESLMAPDSPDLDSVSPPDLLDGYRVKPAKVSQLQPGDQVWMSTVDEDGSIWNVQEVELVESSDAEVGDTWIVKMLGQDEESMTQVEFDSVEGRPDYVDAFALITPADEAPAPTPAPAKPSISTKKLTLDAVPTPPFGWEIDETATVADLEPGAKLISMMGTTYTLKSIKPSPVTDNAVVMKLQTDDGYTFDYTYDSGSGDLAKIVPSGSTLKAAPVEPAPDLLKLNPTQAAVQLIAGADDAGEIKIGSTPTLGPVTALPSDFVDADLSAKAWGELAVGDWVYAPYSQFGAGSYVHAQITGVSGAYSGDSFYVYMQTANGKKFSVRVVPTSDPPSRAVIKTFAPDGPAPKITFKNDIDGTIMANGVAVGTWVKTWNGRRATIKKEFSITGHSVSLDLKGKDDWPYVGASIATKKLPPPTVKKPKKPAAYKLAATVAAGPSGADDSTPKLPNGVHAKPGLKVKVTTPKKTYEGVVTGWPDQTKYPGLLYVQSPDGKKNQPNLKYVAPLEAVGTPPAGYKGPLTKDGKIPMVGMKIKTGKAGLEGTLVNFSEKTNYVTVMLPDGTKKTTTLATTTVLSDAIEDVDVPGAPAPVSVEPKTAPIYKVPRQTDSAKDKWTSPGRDLMADRSVPFMGMPVRDKKGVPFHIVGWAGAYTQSQNTIYVADSEGNIFSRQVHGLEFDVEAWNTAAPQTIGQVAAVYTGWSGGAELKGKVFTEIPEGSLILQVTGARDTGAGFKIVSPNGKIGGLHEGYISWYEGGMSDKKNFAAIYAQLGAGQLKPVGYYDKESSTGIFVSKVSQYKVKNGSAPAWAATQDIIDYNIDDVGFANDSSADDAAQAAIGTKLLKKHANISAQEQEKLAAEGNLPKFVPPVASIPPPPAPPSPAGQAAAKTVFPAPTGAVGKYDEAPAVQGAKSVVDAVDTLLKEKDSKDPNSGVWFTSIDSDKVGDQQIRFQVVTKPDGTQVVEARLKLLQPYADEIGTKLTTTGSGKKGAWDQAMLSVLDLKEGDLVNLRIGSVKGVDGAKQLKPATGNEPNATIVGEPKKVFSAGEDGHQFDTYRWTVKLSDGTLAECDMEDRDSPTIMAYAWNPEKPVAAYGASSVVTAEASADGWTTMGKAGNALAGVSDTGTKTLNGGVKPVSHAGNTLRKTLDDGTTVTFQYVHPGESPNIGFDSPRWGTSVNEVMVQIPVERIEKGELPESLTAALETMGLSVEEQRPPSAKDMATMAMRKAAWQTDVSWKPGKNYNDVDGNPNNPATQAVLKSIEKQLGDGKPVTIDDVRMYVDAHGKITAGWSDDMVKRIAKKQGIQYYAHHLSSSSADRIYSIMAGAAGSGLMSTDERWSRGVTTNGMSSDSDMRIGSGDRVYLRPYKSASTSMKSGYVYVSPWALLRSMDSYVNPGDAFGRRSTTNKWLASAPNGGSSEIMYKGQLPADMLGHVVVDSKTRATVLDMLKKNGITMIGNRKPEEILVTPTTVTSPALAPLGVDGALGTPISAMGGLA